MRLEIFSILDRATGQYGSPMFMISKGQAIRALTDEVNRADPTNQLHTHPGDFDLWMLGEFENTRAEFQLKTPELIIKASDLKEKSA